MAEHNMTRTDGFSMSALEPVLKYAYVTIYDGKSNVFCEGLFSALRRAFNLSELPIKSFYVFESEDGGTFVDFYMR